MPVTQPNQPTVAVQVPVPTPVTPRKKQIQQPVTIPKQQPQLNAFIFPWSPTKKPQKAKLRRIGTKFDYMAAPPRWFGHNPDGVSWFRLDTFLGKRQSKRIGSNKTIYRDSNGDIHVRLHKTDVVTVHHPNNGGDYTLRGNDWPTPTTARTIAYITGRPVSYAGGELKVDGNTFIDGQKLSDIYKLPEAPEVDWRPNEMIPEDYHTMSRIPTRKIKFSR